MKKLVRSLVLATLFSTLGFVSTTNARSQSSESDYTSLLDTGYCTIYCANPGLPPISVPAEDAWDCQQRCIEYCGGPCEPA
jgi:hypothetical protein